MSCKVFLASVQDMIIFSGIFHSFLVFFCVKENIFIYVFQTGHIKLDFHFISNRNMNTIFRQLVEEICQTKVDQLRFLFLLMQELLC